MHLQNRGTGHSVQDYTKDFMTQSFCGGRDQKNGVSLGTSKKQQQQQLSLKLLNKLNENNLRDSCEIVSFQVLVFSQEGQGYLQTVSVKNHKKTPTKTAHWQCQPLSCKGVSLYLHCMCTCSNRARKNTQ